MLGLGNESYNANNKPRTLVCFICGREYGTLSLPIHLKTCEQKFLSEEQKKPKHLRRPLPQKPKILGEGMNQKDIDQYNQNAFETYNNDALETCHNCGRTFKPESLVIHQKMCKPDRPFKPLTGFVQDKKKIEIQQSNKPQTQERGYGQSVQQPVLKRPKTLMCYICGREYGTKSLGIHIKQCKEMFLVQENKKPKADRRKPPSTPPALMDLLSNEDITDSDIQAYNTGAYNKYNYEALVPCPNCARTFKPESFVHHQKACFADKPFKPLNQEGGGTSSLQPCSKCGRSFVPDRLEKHQSVCKGDNVKIDPSKTTNIPSTKWVKPEQIPNQSQVQQTQPKAPENSSKQLKCYVCKKGFQTILLKSHTIDCSKRHNYQGTIPPLFTDLIKLVEPSEFLIDLYHQSLGVDNEKQNPIKQNNEYLDNDEDLRESKVYQDTTESMEKSNSYPGQVEPQTEKAETQSNYRKQFKPSLEESKSSLQPTKEEPNEEEANEEEDQGQEQQVSLVECTKCQRRFTADRITKHQKVCKGTRIQDVKVEKLQPIVDKPPKKEGEVPKWKQQHEAFTKVIQYNKKLKDIEDKGGDIRQLGPPPRASDDHLSKCPYCSRKFDPTRIETHINICQNVVNKPKAVPQQQMNTPGRDFKINTPQKQINKSYGEQSSEEQKRPSSKSQTSNLKPLTGTQVLTKSPYKPQPQQPQQSNNIFQTPAANYLQAPKNPNQSRIPNNKSQDFEQSYGQKVNDSKSAQRTKYKK